MTLLHLCSISLFPAPKFTGTICRIGSDAPLDPSVLVQCNDHPSFLIMFSEQWDCWLGKTLEPMQTHQHPKGREASLIIFAPLNQWREKEVI